MRRCQFCERELPDGKRADAVYCDEICGREFRRQRAGVSIPGRVAARFWARYRLVRRSPARRALGALS
jgi:hypothetical protein